MNPLLAQLFALGRQRPVVAGCYALALLLGVANYFLWQRREIVTADHGAERRNGEFMLNALANRAQIDADLTALRSAVEQIERNLVDERSMEVNLGYFYRLERITRIRLVRLNQLGALPPAAGSPFMAVPFSMHITGSYRNIMRFLHELETGPRLLRVRNCSFERGAEENVELLLDLTVDVLAKA